MKTEKNKCSWLILLFLQLFFFHSGYSQSLQLKTIQKTPHSATVFFNVEPNALFNISLNFRFTAIAFKIPASSRLEGTYLLAGKEKIRVYPDEHMEADSNNMLTSNLIHLNELTDSLKLFSGELKGSVQILMFNGSYRDKRKLTIVQADTCTEPTSIDQEIWRKGLAPPSYQRSFSTVKHVIVHHSAGSNSSTDYYQVVRDIYLYHTQGNGWSDIGYNYLVAPDGTIFKGRDPDDGEQDNVIGAHFCAKNTGTMGICMLGTYTNVSPSKEAVNSLVNLASWKFSKENLSSVASSDHQGVPLNNLAGHRDGCATECPGNKIYEMLPSLRDRIKLTIQNCIKDDVEDSLKFYPVPTFKPHLLIVEAPDNQAVSIEKIYNQLGQEVYPSIQIEAVNILKINWENIGSGIYYVIVNYRNNLYTFKEILLN